jgi:hypothetical protein
MTIPISPSVRAPSILVLVSCAPAPPEPAVRRTEQTEIACQDVEGLSFAEPEAWTTVSEDYLTYAEWLTDAVYRFDAGGTVRQDVAALTVFDDVLYAGIGDWHFNAGSRFCPEQGSACPYEDAPGHGIPLVTFSPGSSEPTFDHVLPEEQIGRFRRTGDALLVPGIDPSDGDGAPACCLEDPTSGDYCGDEAARTHERFERGTLYLQSHDGWFETDALEGGIHVFDVSVLDGMMYAAGAAEPVDGGPSAATVWRSEDGGRSWSVALRMEDAPHSRFVALAPLGEGMLVFGYDEHRSLLSFRIDRQGESSLADLLPDLRGIVATEPFTRDEVLAWSTSGRVVDVLTAMDGEIAVRALDGLEERRLVATYLLCAGDLLLLSTSGSSYAVDRTQDLEHLDRVVEFESAATITSFAFWDGSLVFGADGGQLLRTGPASR